MMMTPRELLKDGGHLNHMTLLISLALLTLLVQDLDSRFCICICILYLYLRQYLYLYWYLPQYLYLYLNPESVSICIWIQIHTSYSNHDDLIGQNPIYLSCRVLLVKNVDNVDYMGGLKHMGVVSKCPGDDDDDDEVDKYEVVDNDDDEEEEDNLSTALFM